VPGGCGPTTLLVDCDSQANATAAIGFQKDPARRTLYNLLILNEPFERIAQKSQVEGLDVIPADKNLAGAAVELVSSEGREYKLQAVLNTLREKISLYCAGLSARAGSADFERSCGC